MGFEVRGTVALVTGANRGIGRAIVESLLAHGAARVYAAVRHVATAQELVSASGGRVVAVPLDLRNDALIQQAARQASDVRLVINNAGMLKVASALDTHAIEALREEMDVNVYGLLRIAQAFAPVLKANGGGAFVQLNSVASLKCFAAFATYSASKAAAYSMTQGLRELLAAQGTQVLSVHPGPIDTDMARSAGLGDIAEPASIVGEGIVQALRSGDYHLFPDTMARQFEAAYRGFSQQIIEVRAAEG